MNIESILKTGLAEGLNSLFGASAKPEDIVLQSTKKEFEGTYTFTTFAFTKITKVSPEETGKKLGEYLQANSGVVSGFNVVKGFLNLVIAQSAWAKLFELTLSKDTFGKYPSNGKKVMVEYSSPNTNKPLHLGHLRNNFLGYSIAEILKAHGYQVVKANLINDRGIHICKSMLAYEKFGNAETPESSGLKGDHLVGKYYVEFEKRLKEDISAQLNTFKEFLAEDLTEENKAIIVSAISSASRGGKDPFEKIEKDAKTFVKKPQDKELKQFLAELANKVTERTILSEAKAMLLKWEQGDPQVVNLWKKMNGWVYDGFNETYNLIGVNFDKFYYESDTYLLGKDIVDEGLQKEVFFKKENGAVWVDLTADGLDEKLLLRADGTSVYITQDIGTAELKYIEFRCDKSIYVVGNEQDYHFKVLKLVLKKLDKPYADGLYHMSYGMVDLPSGKMKSREGTVVDADDLVHSMIEEAKAETMSHGKSDGFNEEEAAKLFRQLGLGALKYYLLRVDPAKRMLFNPEESIQLNGDTGPYIQYMYARSRSVMRKIKELGIDHSEKEYQAYTALQPTEVDLIIALNRYPAVIKEAADQYSPAVIAQYCIDLAREFNRFYNEVPIMKEENAAAKAFRIALTETSGKIIQKAMSLLGVEVPEKM
ncbi:MAG TPA: arginine--tRNA ligase [Cytophagaceae bacterium]|nr:arginine--tRNA ligase [Cytophagaceae bacterium]